jgi:hypothetical protein
MCWSLAILRKKFVPPPTFFSFGKYSFSQINTKYQYVTAEDVVDGMLQLTQTSVIPAGRNYVATGLTDLLLEPGKPVPVF